MSYEHDIGTVLGCSYYSLTPPYLGACIAPVVCKLSTLAATVPLPSRYSEAKSQGLVFGISGGGPGIPKPKP